MLALITVGPAVVARLTLVSGRRFQALKLCVNLEFAVSSERERFGEEKKDLGFSAKQLSEESA